MGAISAVMAMAPKSRKMAADMVLAGDKPRIRITEPDAGSDANGMTTAPTRRATLRRERPKHWITGGGVSRLHLIFARSTTRRAT